MRGLDSLLFNFFNYQTVFLRVFLQLIAYSAHNTLNLALEQLLKLNDADVGVGRRALYTTVCRCCGSIAPSLIFEHGRDMSVVLAILLSTLTVVQVDEHVSQELVQSVVDGGIIGIFLLLLLLLRL